MQIRNLVRTAVDELRGYWQGPFTLNNPNTPLSAWFDGRPASSGVSVDENVAFNYSAFWSAVQLIAGDCATLPLHLYSKQSDGSRTRNTIHPLARVLDDRANPEQGALAVRECLTANALATGNAYAEISRDSQGRTVGLWPIVPSRVQPFRQPDQNGRLGPLQYRIDGHTILDVRDVFHLHGLSWDGVVGKSVVAAARDSLGLALAAERMGGSFFSNGSHFGGFLKHPGKLGKDARQSIRESIAERHEGSGNAHKWLLLQDGMEAQAIGLSPHDSQFLESRLFQVSEIARWFNLPPTKLSEYSRATYSNSEQSNIDYYTSCLRRWLTRWESEIQLKLVNPSEQQLFAEHKTDAILRGDVATRYTAYKTGREGGWLSMNDIRRLENLDPVDGGDGYLVPLNMQTIGPSSPKRDDNSAIFQTRAHAVVVSAAIRDVMVDAFARCCRREAGKARSYQAMPSKLRAWVETYYDSTERARWLEQLRPSIKAWQVVAGREGVDVDTACGAILDRHFETSKRELLRIADLGEGFAFSDALQRKLTAWDSDRAATTIDRLIQHGVPAELPGGLSVSMASAMLKQSPEPRARTVSMANAVLKQALVK